MIISLIADISEQLGRLSAWQEARDENALRLRRINRIRTIQGSLAIEGNTLSEEQITAILDGKRVIAPIKEVQEARNAIQVYEHLDRWQPTDESHLLQAHQMLMLGLVDDAGSYRQGNVGVMNGDVVVHMAPPADRVRKLMRDLFGWLASTDHHPLIVSSVFHYEFEFIHPFSDGNGRMGRLWQTAILSQWQPLLAQLPVESMVHAHQKAYYQAINRSTAEANSAHFIEFMLDNILATLVANEETHSAQSAQSTPQDAPQVTPQVKALLMCLLDETSAMGREALQQQLNLKDRKSFRARYLKPALEAALIEMTLPDKPNSRLQQYQLTPLGQQVSNE